MYRYIQCTYFTTTVSCLWRFLRIGWGFVGSLVGCRCRGIGSRGISLFSRVDWGALEAHISNKASLVGGSVSGGLETAIGESDGVGPSNVACNVKINKKVGLGILVKQRNKQICLIISN